MVKIKVAFISIAVILAIGGAFATRPRAICEEQTQYFKWGSIYLPAGQYGVHYVCIGSAGICTYFKPLPTEPYGYVPCRTGTFSFVYGASANQ